MRAAQMRAIAQERIAMTKMWLPLSLLIVSCLAAGVAWGRPVPVSSWQLNGTLGNEIAGGDPLTVNGGQAVTFTTATIGGVSAQVADVPAFSNDANNLSAVNPIGANGGGARRKRCASRSERTRRARAYALRWCAADDRDVTGGTWPAHCRPLQGSCRTARLSPRAYRTVRTRQSGPALQNHY